MQTLWNTLWRRTYYRPQPVSLPLKYQSLCNLLSVLLFLSALFFLMGKQISTPGLYMEDAGHYFNIYYGRVQDFFSIMQNPNGYFNVINNFIAWLAAFTDVRFQPWFYLIFALLMGVYTASSMLFSGLFQSRSIRLISCMVLGLVGMNHAFYFNTLTFQMYNVVILLLCLLFYQLPPSKSIVFLCCLWAVLLIWSGPYSVVAFPVSLLFLVLFRNEEKTILFLLVMLTVLFYSASVSQGTIMLGNIADPTILRVAWKTLIEQVFFFNLFGKITTIKVVLLFVLLSTIIYSLRENSFFLKNSLILFSIIIAALAPLFLSVKYLLYQTVFPCHIYASQFFWAVFLLFSADQLILKYSTVRPLPYLLTLAFLALIIADNNPNRTELKGRDSLMPHLAEFTRAVHKVEQLHLERNNTYVIMMADNLKPPFMPLAIRVGSNRTDARQIGSNELHLPEVDEHILAPENTE